MGRAMFASVLILAAAAAGAIAGRLSGPDAPVAQTSTVTTQPVATQSAGMSLEDAVTLTGPSVVEVRTRFGQGSGVIVEPQGLIITNNHVVAGENQVEVKTASGASIFAEVLRTDEFQDLAVLRPISDAGPGVLLVDDAAGPPRVGSSVFAIGSPFGFQNTVTAGVVSAFRTDEGRPLIQFDAPVNPGNSGGGLFNLEGRLVGIPTSIQSPVQGNVGLGFAVPASRVRQMLARVS